MADCLYLLCDILCKGCIVQDMSLVHFTKSTKHKQKQTAQFWGFIESVPDQKEHKTLKKYIMAVRFTSSLLKYTSAPDCIITLTFINTC